LPHAQITQMAVREIPGAYELWMICVSRGLAVLTVPMVDLAAAPVVDGSPRLTLESRPSPFRDAAEITFELPAVGPVRLAVLDVQGRRVRHLIDAALPAGSHRTRWDGTDESGRETPAGVYFYELTSAAGRATRRVVRIR
jgi:hypothetical protein